MWSEMAKDFDGLDRCRDDRSYGEEKLDVDFLFYYYYTNL